MSDFCFYGEQIQILMNSNNAVIEYVATKYDEVESTSKGVLIHQQK